MGEQVERALPSSGRKTAASEPPPSTAGGEASVRNPATLSPSGTALVHPAPPIPERDRAFEAGQLARGLEVAGG